MNVVFLLGNHPRHRYIARQLDEAGYLDGMVVEQRETHIPEPPEDLDDHLSKLYRHHFERRAAAEEEFFGDPTFPDVPSFSTSPEDLNSEGVREFIRDHDPNITLSYGVHILSEETLAAIPGKAWNVHGGLSPQYRGVITHFWPSYMLEPQMTGVTLHELTTDVDAGPIVHQTGANLVRGDGVHQLASRTVKRFAEELPQVLDLAARGDLNRPVKQESAGKLWLSTDWRPEHLVVIYDKFNNDIVDRYLNGEIEGKEPDLIRQFEK
ncbi:MAG: formyl transferase [Halobacteriaceae archaeon]